MKMEGCLAELMVATDPKLFYKFVITNPKGLAVLYAKGQKVLHGMLNNGLLFLKLIVDLKNFRFCLNPCDVCMARMAVNGNQMTETWHVNNLMVSHKDPSEITIFAIYLYKIY